MMTVMLCETCALVLALVGSAVLTAETQEPLPAANVSISGRVVDQTSAPIANVIVSLEIPGGSAPGTTTRTNQSGDFTFSDVPPREYDPDFRSPGFRSFTARLPIGQDLKLPTIVLFPNGTNDPEVTAEDMAAPLMTSPITQTLRPQSNSQNRPGNAERAEITSPEILVLGARAVVSVDVHVNTAKEQLAIPYCNKLETEADQLCYSHTHLEARDKGGWRSVRLRHEEIVLGDLQPRVRLIAARSGHDLVYYFSPEIFLVDHGQQLRIVLDAWTDEQSTKSHAPSTKIVSPPFTCP